MGQKAELSELRQRAEAVGARFGAVAEDSRQCGDRLAGLLDQVEAGVVRGRREIERLRQDLAESREESAQLHDLLQRVLALAAKVEGPGERIVLCDLEARVHRLCDQAAAMNGAMNDAANEAVNRTNGSGKGAVKTAGNGAEKAARAPGGADPGRREPVPDGAANGGSGADGGPPLELTRRIDEGGEVTGVANDTGGPVAMETRPVQDIFKRVSMMTGRLRET